MSSPVPTPAAARREIGVLVVAHHPARRAALRELLHTEPGFHCIAALSHAEGLAGAIAESRPDVVVLDYALRADDGLTTCFRLKQRPQRAGGRPVSGTRG